MKNILISGYYGFKNTGDELVLQEIIRGLKLINKEVSITVLSSDPEYTKNKYNVNSKDRWSFFQIISSILKTDLLISGGGSLLQDKTSKNGILYYLGIILLGKIFGKKVVVFSQGVGPLESSRNRSLVKNILSKANYISVRDEDSLSLLEEIGIEKSIDLSGDPVFLIEPTNEEKTKELWRNLGLDEGKKLVTVSLRPWDNVEKIINETEAFLSTFNRDEFQIKYLSFHQGEDEKILNGKVSEKEILSHELNPEDFAVIIGSSYLTIGMRLHSLILAAAQGVKFISISYDPKVKSLDNEIYSSLVNIDTNNISKDLLLEKYEEIKEIKYENDKIKKRALKPFEYIMSR